MYCFFSFCNCISYMYINMYYLDKEQFYQLSLHVYWLFTSSNIDQFLKRIWWSGAFKLFSIACISAMLELSLLYCVHTSEHQIILYIGGFYCGYLLCPPLLTTRDWLLYLLLFNNSLLHWDAFEKKLNPRI